MASLTAVQSLIDSGAKKEASEQLKQCLREEPSAQAWYLAALLVDDEAQKVTCLQRALELDALHTPSNRLLHQIQTASERQKKKRLPLAESAELQLNNREQKFKRMQQEMQQRRRRRGMGCLMSLILSSMSCVVILSIAGMIPGTISMMIQLSSGVAPVHEINEVAIEDIDDSVFQIIPVSSQPLTGQHVDFIDHGYVKEYTIEVSENAPYGIYVQFLSLTAHNLNQNLVIVDSRGNNITAQCLAQRISEYDSGIAYSCRPKQSEQWLIRIIGIRGETIGGYIIGLQTLETNRIQP